MKNIIASYALFAGLVTMNRLAKPVFESYPSHAFELSALYGATTFALWMIAFKYINKKFK
ncbi:hypothetical protein [Paenibacillus xylanexedens]|uniref:hypothetical protein n=1 Tax=Paenibacillus xylanexedens TaxID=528191 RepID=UPI000F52F881|nr:hypothetical protein [Paenibacillus xylanexedens]RPK31763.1 hypothetical protein EDO6_02390 [Paenibacillus xylanexedens]